MANLSCDISDGCRASEVTVSLRDHAGKRHVVRVERDFLNDGLLPVEIKAIDERRRLILVELPPNCAMTLDNRIWISASEVTARELVCDL